MIERATSRTVARTNPALARFTTVHGFSVIAEWAAFIGALTYAHGQAGDRAAGLASVIILIPYVLVAPVGAAVAERHHPVLLRCGLFVAQAGLFAGAAALAVAGAPWLGVVASISAALGSIAIVRPTSAMILPAIARTSEELTTANLWFGWVEGLSVLLGPSLATVLLAAGGPPAILVGCGLLTAGSAIGAARSFRSDRESVPDVPPGPRTSVVGVAARSARVVRGRRGLTSVLVVAGVQFVLVGALDLLIVLMADSRYALGVSGAGLLGTAIGLGALASLLVAAVLIGRCRLSHVLTVGLAAVAAGCFALGASSSLLVALLALPALGLCRSLLDVSSRTLLQRSAPPAHLGGVFAVLEVLTGVGMMAGSLTTQAVLAHSTVGHAFVVLGVVVGLVAVFTRRSLRDAEASADVPVVTIALLAGHERFSALPAEEIETIARTAEILVLEPGAVLVRQGDRDDRHFIVADGEFDVVQGGVTIHSAVRGASLSEIARSTGQPFRADVISQTRGRVVAFEVVSPSDAARSASARSARVATPNLR